MKPGYSKSGEGMMKLKRGELALPKMKETFHLSEEMLPAIKDWTVGEEYEIKLEVKMVAHSDGSQSMLGRDTGHEATFEILEAESEEEEPEEADDEDKAE